MENDISRRNFLKIAVQGLLGVGGLLTLGGLIRFLSFKPAPPPPKRFEIGLETNFPPGSRTVLLEIPGVLIHDLDGFHALSLVCTHLGCSVEAKVDSFACQCHGSRYDKNGNVTHGPATKPLAQLNVERSPDGSLTVLKS